MANRQIPTSLIGIIKLREQRVFRCHYMCELCPNEWSDDLIVQTHGWCPSCDGRVKEPYYVEELSEERPGFDTDE